jgi:hypothetical protein
MLNSEIEYLVDRQCTVSLSFPDFGRNLENPQKIISSSNLVYGRITGYFVCNGP